MKTEPVTLKPETHEPANPEALIHRPEAILHVCGLNHNRASLFVRENFALGPDKCKEALERLRDDAFTSEAMILSTCNRTEIYAYSPLEESFSDHLEEFFLTLALKPIDPEHSPPLYSYEGLEAARHFFAVNAGLDSMILGENEIKAQIRQSFDLCKETGTAGPNLHRLTEATHRCAKRIKTETDLNTGTLSVGRAAILRAEQALGTLEGKVCVVIGAGKVGRIAAESIAERKPGELLIINRTPEKAEEVAKGLNATVLSIPDMAPAIQRADLVLGAAFAPNFLVTKQMFEAVRRGAGAASERPVCLIDTAVPRILDREIAEIPGVTLLDISQMEEIVAANHARRKAAAQQAWGVVEEEVEKFKKKSETFAIGPMLERLKNKFDSVFDEFIQEQGGVIAAEEVEKYRLEQRKLKQRLFHAAISEIKQYHLDRKQ